MKLLCVGNLNYHEETIALPLLGELVKLGVDVKRIQGGIQGDTAFFLPANYSTQIKHWTRIPDSFADYEAIFFIDFWNPAVPLWCYRMYTEKVFLPMGGLFHGSAYMDGDVCRDIPFASHYEEYLWAAMQAVFAPYNIEESVCLPPPTQHTLVQTKWPATFALNNATKSPHEWKPAVVFNSRWSYDKGAHNFVKFAQVAAKKGIQCIATCNRPSDYHGNNDIEFVGWLSRDRMRALFSNGGYVFGQAKQECMAYAIIEAVLSGATPLLADLPIYNYQGFPKEYHWKTHEQAIDMILSHKVISQDDLAAYKARLSGGEHALATAIIKNLG